MKWHRDIACFTALKHTVSVQIRDMYIGMWNPLPGFQSQMNVEVENVRILFVTSKSHPRFFGVDPNNPGAEAVFGAEKTIEL